MPTRYRCYRCCYRYRCLLRALNVIRTQFDATLPMSTYLLAWVVSDFSATSADGAAFRTWARPALLNTEGAVALSQSVGPAVLKKIEDMVHIPYALPKLDQFAIPDFDAGAMENWGLVTYRSVSLSVHRGRAVFPTDDTVEMASSTQSIDTETYRYFDIPSIFPYSFLKGWPNIDT